MRWGDVIGPGDQVCGVDGAPASTPLDLIRSCLRIIREDLTGGTYAMRASNLEVAVPVSSLVQGDRD
jgi:hypothetical protein